MTETTHTSNTTRARAPGTFDISANGQSRQARSHHDQTALSHAPNSNPRQPRSILKSVSTTDRGQASPHPPIKNQPRSCTNASGRTRFTNAHDQDTEVEDHCWPEIITAPHGTRVTVERAGTREEGDMQTRIRFELGEDDDEQWDGENIHEISTPAAHHTSVAFAIQPTALNAAQLTELVDGKPGETDLLSRMDLVERSTREISRTIRKIEQEFDDGISELRERFRRLENKLRASMECRRKTGSGEPKLESVEKGLSDIQLAFYDLQAGVVEDRRKLLSLCETVGVFQYSDADSRLESRAGDREDRMMRQAVCSQ